MFTDIYHFNLGLSGLPFLAFVVSGAITVSVVIFLQIPKADNRSLVHHICFLLEIPRCTSICQSRCCRHRHCARDTPRDRSDRKHLHSDERSHLWIHLERERPLDRPRHRRCALPPGHLSHLPEYLDIYNVSVPYLRRVGPRWQRSLPLRHRQCLPTLWTCVLRQPRFGSGLCPTRWYLFPAYAGVLGTSHSCLCHPLR